jgi:hypothetical protein
MISRCSSLSRSSVGTERLGWLSPDGALAADLATVAEFGTRTLGVDSR